MVSRKNFPIFLLHFFLIFTQCGNSSNAPSDNPAAETMVVSRGNIGSKLQLTGIILPEKMICLRPVISGKIEKLWFTTGDTVKKGDVIADIFPDQSIFLALLQKENNVWKRKLAFEKDEKDYHNQQALFREQLISQAEFETTQSVFLMSQREYRLAEMELELFKTESGIKSDSAGNFTNRSRLKAPFDGIILKMAVTSGDYVKSAFSQYSDGTEICTIGNLEALIVQCQVSEFDILKVKPGHAVEVSLENSKNKDSGKIVQVAPMANEGSNPVTFDLVVKFEPVHNQYRPGISVGVDVLLAMKQNVLLIPIEAVLGKKGQGIVVVAGNVAGRRTIQTGISDNHNIEVLNGLEENERVYLNPREMLKTVPK
jgi:RND family efflux transporter MFP subunit